MHSKDENQPTVPRHHLARDDFATLARGEGSPEITRRFWEGEYSRRKLLLATVLDEARVRPDTVDSVPSALEVLLVAEAKNQARNGLRDLLLDPGVGSGLAYALRRLRGGAVSTTPIWVDLGIVHTLALVAAASAGVTWSTRLPLRDGRVMLPTLGMATFAGCGPAGTVEAGTEDGRIWMRHGEHELRVPADGSDMEPAGAQVGWWSLRQIRVGDDLPLEVRLDDLDPLRDLADPVPPARLDAATFEHWRRLLGDAWELLCRDYRPDAEAMAGGVVMIAPLRSVPGAETRSASNGEAFGSVMVSPPPDPVTLAVTLVHEFQHIKLGALLHLVRLTEPADGALLYAPWRDDPRPLAGLVQGIYAFFGIAKFWRERSGDGPATFEYWYARQQTAEALRTALAAPGLTVEGRTFFAELQACLEEWPAEVDPGIARLVEITAGSHRIGWRLRHFQPGEDEVAELAGRFTRGEAPPAPLPARFVPHPELRWRQRIPEQARRQAREGAAQPGDPLAEGEIALLAGHSKAAAAAFLAALGRHTGPATDDEAGAWVGLALSLAADGNDAATALVRRPDLVRAVYAEVGSVTPVDVAAWLAPAVCG